MAPSKFPSPDLNFRPLLFVNEIPSCAFFSSDSTRSFIASSRIFRSLSPSCDHADDAPTTIAKTASTAEAGIRFIESSLSLSDPPSRGAAVRERRLESVRGRAHCPREVSTFREIPVKDMFGMTYSGGPAGDGNVGRMQKSQTAWIHRLALERES